MSALYPNVPLVIAGVPAVLRRIGAVQDAQEALASADQDATSTVDSFRWGIFDKDGNLALEPTSFGSFEFGLEYRIADYPLEGGGFESYDKVATPYDTRIALTKSGSLAEREGFLAVVHRLVGSLELYSIVTPERTYLDVSFERVGMVRNATNGAGMLTVEMILREVRAAAKAQFSKTQTETLTATTQTAPTPKVSATPKTVRSASSARPVNRGAAQPKPVVNPGVKLQTTTSGRKLYVYDRPPGK